MKAESTVMPVAPYEIEFDGELVDIIFFENVEPKEVAEDEVEKWEYDEYRLRIRNRDNLEAVLDNNYEAWLAAAKEKENEIPEETDKEKIVRLENENRELTGVIDDLIQILVDKGVVW